MNAPDPRNATVEQLQPIMQSRLSKRLRSWSPEDVEDISQEAWAALFEALPSHDSSRGALEAFVSRVVDRTIIDSIRKRKIVRQIKTERVGSEDALPEFEIDNPINDMVLGEVIEGMTFDQLELLGVAFSCGGRAAEVAEELGITIKSATQRLSRLRKMIRDAA
jgi:RNA polymerase sigma factor (sigma-70 family)